MGAVPPAERGSADTVFVVEINGLMEYVAFLYATISPSRLVPAPLTNAPLFVVARSGPGDATCADDAWFTHHFTFTLGGLVTGDQPTLIPEDSCLGAPPHVLGPLLLGLADAAKSASAIAGHQVVDQRGSPRQCRRSLAERLGCRGRHGAAEDRVAVADGGSGRRRGARMKTSEWALSSAVAVAAGLWSCRAYGGAAAAAFILWRTSIVLDPWVGSSSPPTSG